MHALIISSFYSIEPIHVSVRWPRASWSNIMTICSIPRKVITKTCWYSICIWIINKPTSSSYAFILLRIYPYHILPIDIIRIHALFIHALCTLYINDSPLFWGSVSWANYSEVGTNLTFIYTLLVVNRAMDSCRCQIRVLMRMRY